MLERMLETLKSIAFVVGTVIIALVLQAQAGSLIPESGQDTNESPTEHLTQVYN